MGFELGDLLTAAGNLARRMIVRVGHDPVGVADIEGVAFQRHAERLVQTLQENLLMLGHAIAIGIAQQRDPVGADAGRLRPFHRGDDGVVERRADAAGGRHRLGHQHIAVWQNLHPAGVVETGCEGIDLQPRRSSGRLPRRKALRRRHFQRHDALRLRLWHIRVGANRRRMGRRAEAAHHDGGAANDSDALCDDLR